MLAIHRWMRRELGYAANIFSIHGKAIALPRSLQGMKLPLPSNPFRCKFLLTSVIEPELAHPIDANHPAAVSVITTLQGPKLGKYAFPLDIVEEVNNLLGIHWQNYIVAELITHAQSQEQQGVALLRPEYNPAIHPEKLERLGLNPEEIASIHSQYYATARKNKMKKMKGSRYHWRFF